MGRAAQLLHPFSVGYESKVLSYGPIGYWPLWEAAGSQAMDLSGKGRHGTHAGVTLGQHKQQFTCPFYDGANDYMDAYCESFRDAFDGAEGSVIVWGKVYDAGVWTDGAGHALMELRVDAQNRIRILKAIANNRLNVSYESGNIVEQRQLDGVTSTDWMCVGMSWSKSTGVSGEVRFFVDGVQEGATEVGLGVWAGNLAVTTTVIGAGSTVPVLVWHGWLAHCAVWDVAVSPREMVELAVVP